jgi:hypothetical protein
MVANGETTASYMMPKHRSKHWLKPSDARHHTYQCVSKLAPSICMTTNQAKSIY